MYKRPDFSKADKHNRNGSTGFSRLPKTVPCPGHIKIKEAEILTSRACHNPTVCLENPARVYNSSNTEPFVDMIIGRDVFI